MGRPPCLPVFADPREGMRKQFFASSKHIFCNGIDSALITELGVDGHQMSGHLALVE